MPDSTPAPDVSHETKPLRLSSWGIFCVWFGLGIQSFGGGGATLALMHRAAVEQYRWISEEEFAREWALCLFAPGINLFAMTILLGRRIAGWRGVLLCLTGLILPSVTITILLTAVYARIRESALIQAALRGVIPASVGLGLLTAFTMILPPLRKAQRQGIGDLLFVLFLVVACALLSLTGKISTLALLGGSGALAAVVNVARTARKQKNAGESTP